MSSHLKNLSEALKNIYAKYPSL